MKKNPPEKVDTRDASLRVSKHVRDSLKMAAAVMGRPLYDVTTEAIEKYMACLEFTDPSSALRRARVRQAPK